MLAASGRIALLSFVRCSSAQTMAVLPRAPLLLLAALALGLAASPAAAASAGKRQLVGGISEADISEQGVQQALDFALSEYNKASNDAFHSRALRVVRARKQVRPAGRRGRTRAAGYLGPRGRGPRAAGDGEPRGRRAPGGGGRGAAGAGGPGGGGPQGLGARVVGWSGAPSPKGEARPGRAWPARRQQPRPRRPRACGRAQRGALAPGVWPRFAAGRVPAFPVTVQPSAACHRQCLQPSPQRPAPAQWDPGLRGAVN